MTREEAMQKVVSIEPITKDELRRVCGWPTDEFERALNHLIKIGRLTYRHIGGHRMYQVVA